MSLDVTLPTPGDVKVGINYGTTGGQNQRDLATRLAANQAVKIQNYFVKGDGRMVTREGILKIEEIADEIGERIVTMDSDNLAYCYYNGTSFKFAIYNISSNTSTVIQTEEPSGINANRLKPAMKRYGKYLIYSVGGLKVMLHYLNGKFLKYDSQSTNFTIGETVTGATSGATGVVTADTDDGSSGALVLTSRNGTAFQNNEQLNGSVGGNNMALADGADRYWFQLSESPKASVLEIYNSYNGAFLMAGDTDTNESQVRWAEAITDPTVIPFTNWTASDDPAGSGVNLTESGGKVNSIVSHRNLTVVFYDDATKAFKLDVIDDATAGLKQFQVTQHQEFNFGGYNSISTPMGIFYTNENGVYQMEFSGEDKLESEISNILGEDQIENYNFENSTLLWDGKERIYVQLGENSTTNNFCLVYNVKLKIWTEITGWNIQELCKVSFNNVNKIYGISSSGCKIYEVFSGYQDDGTDIDGKILYKQEDGGDPVMLKDVKSIWMQGKLSASSVIRVDINSWDEDNSVTESAKTYWWAGSDANLEPYGFGVTSYAKGIQKGDIVISEDFVHDGFTPIQNALKYQFQISSSYNLPHEIHFIETEVEFKRRAIRNNFLTSKPS